jgi:hypothetical protein
MSHPGPAASWPAAISRTLRSTLAQLGAERHYEDHMLLTTLEPCGMNRGAAVQASVGCLLYAGSDPHGSTGSLVFGTPQAQRRRLRAAGPLDNERGRLAALLHIVWLLLMPASAHVLAAEAFRTCSTDKPGRAQRRSSYSQTPPRAKLAWPT